MKVIPTEIPDVRIVEPEVFGDERGYFFESWNKGAFEAAGICCGFIQENESRSRFGVLRGLHYQVPPYTQAKLVRVIQGSVLDVAVELSGENKRQLFIPRGFAHGFVVLSDNALFAYMCDNRYAPTHERGIAYDDPELGIDWRVRVERFILSPKDTANPLLADAEVFDFQKKDYLA